MRTRQESDAPDLRLLVVVLILLLDDLQKHLKHPPREHGDRDDLLLRIGAVLAVLHRLRALQEGDEP